MMQSTSPSYLLMASLDWARAYMEEHGREEIDRLLENLFWTRKELQAMGIDTMEDYCRTEIFQTDASRLVLDVSQLGRTGFEAEEILRQAGVQVEMSDSRRMVLICTIADRKDEFRRLVEACRILHREGEIDKEQKKDVNFPGKCPGRYAPKEAFERKKELIPLKEAKGRICGDLVGAYPPGIPRFCPGELIDCQGIEELLENQAKGARLFGLAEARLIPVLAE